MKDSAAVGQIEDSDLWVLLTDGEIHDGYVVELTRLVDEEPVT